MKCIVPLAGPDLIHPVHGLRPLLDYHGQPLLAAALESRPWRAALQSSDFIFVVRAVEPLEVLTAYLAATWPGSRIIVLSDLTEGAMLTVMAGLALAADDEPLIVDLADILFEADLSPTALLVGKVGCVVPCFASSDDCYSYLRSEDGRVVEAAEKRVISDAAPNLVTSCSENSPTRVKTSPRRSRPRAMADFAPK